MKDDHCSHCGARHEAEVYPRKCGACGVVTYINPITVAVAVVPMEGGGLVAVRRAIPPFEGHLALPGGYQELGETFEEAAAREFREECGVYLEARTGIYLMSRPTPSQTLAFIRFPTLAADTVFVAGPEAHSVEVCKRPDDLCFPLHRAAAELHRAGEAMFSAIVR